MACGVPTLVADNTGQHDLVALLGACALTQQTACVTPADPAATTEGWGESSVEECVAGLERIYQDHQAARREAAVIAERVRGWSWHVQNTKLLEYLAAG